MLCGFRISHAPASLLMRTVLDIAVKRWPWSYVHDVECRRMSCALNDELNEELRGKKSQIKRAY